MAFPSAIDSFSVKVDYVSGDILPENIVYASHINTLQNAIAAIETKVGIDNSAVTTSIDYKIAHLSDNFLYKPGIAGGQTVYGGSASGNDFILYSNTLKDGKIKFGDTAYLNETTAKFFGNGYVAYSEAFTSGYASYDQGFAIKKDWVTTGTYLGGAHKAGIHIEVSLDDGGSYYDTVAGVWAVVNYNGAGGSTGASYAGWFQNKNDDTAGDSLGIYAEGYSGGIVGLVSGYGAALSGYDYAPSGGVAIQGYSTSSLGRGIEGIAAGDNSKAIHAQGTSNHSGSYGLYVDFQYTVSAANRKSHIEGILDVGSLKILEGTGATYYTTFQGGDQAADITYTLPTAAPAVSGYALTATTGGVMSWAPAGASAGGSDTQVQFNDGGTALGGDTGLVFNKTTDVLTVAGGVIIGTQPDYTTSNVTTNRTIDANAITYDQLCDIVGTLLGDMTTMKLLV